MVVVMMSAAATARVRWDIHDASISGLAAVVFPACCSVLRWVGLATMMMPMRTCGVDDRLRGVRTLGRVIAHD